MLGTDQQPVRLPKKETRRKRVYKTVAITEENGSYCLLLDGRVLHTPLRAKLVTPFKSLAEVVASEWDAQVEYIDPATMPLTKLLNTCVDRVSSNPEQIVDGLLQYVDTDLLCYRAEGPETLVERQCKVWQPVLDWLSATHGISLPVVQGIIPTAYPPEIKSQMRALMLSFQAPALTAVQGVAALTSSLSLALALVGGRLSGAEVAAAANLDETWQMERWGEDKESRDRLNRLQSDVFAVERFLELQR
ncbi:MAG: ATP12 family protein [Rhodospirillaceae bacterium]